MRRQQSLAFVHRAFWRADTGDGSAEAYIGPVLAALEQRLGTASRALRERRPGGEFSSAAMVASRFAAGALPRHVTPVERSRRSRALNDSRRVWRERHQMRRALWQSADLRRDAVIRGCDCWPVIREELAGIALLQWPWSARAMDEAGAALDALPSRGASSPTPKPAAGAARSMLECRRRGIPSVGLQHGFIYRHWLNYLHEPDEMAADPANPAIAAFLTRREHSCSTTTRHRT